MTTVDDLDQERLIKSHLSRLRACTELATAPIVTVIEANLAWVTVRARKNPRHVSRRAAPDAEAEAGGGRPQASYIARATSEFAPVVHMTSTQGADRARRPGVWMTSEIKQTMRRDTFTLLDTDRLTLWSGFVSGSPGMRGTLATQLRNYKFETKVRTRPGPAARPFRPGHP